MRSSTSAEVKPHSGKELPWPEREQIVLSLHSIVHYGNLEWPRLDSLNARMES
jgi:hypothetical protein